MIPDQLPISVTGESCHQRRVEKVLAWSMRSIPIQGNMFALEGRFKFLDQLWLALG